MIYNRQIIILELNEGHLLNIKLKRLRGLVGSGHKLLNDFVCFLSEFLCFLTSKFIQDKYSSYTQKEAAYIAGAVYDSSLVLSAIVGILIVRI